MRKFLITIVVLNSIIWFGLSSLVKADDYNTAVIGHVISETIKNTDIDTSYIIEQELEKLALKEENVLKFLKGLPKKSIIIPNRIINFVT